MREEGLLRLAELGAGEGFGGAMGEAAMPSAPLADLRRRGFAVGLGISASAGGSATAAAPAPLSRLALLAATHPSGLGGPGAPATGVVTMPKAPGSCEPIALA